MGSDRIPWLHDDDDDDDDDDSGGGGDDDDDNDSDDDNDDNDNDDTINVHQCACRRDESSGEPAPKRIKLEASDRASECDVTSLKNAQPGTRVCVVAHDVME